METTRIRNPNNPLKFVPAFGLHRTRLRAPLSSNVRPLSNNIMNKKDQLIVDDSDARDSAYKTIADNPDFKCSRDYVEQLWTEFRALGSSER